jgi:glucose-1-phosphate thymidylyltransferase
MIPVLILAAGGGTRMGSLGAAHNKALLPIGLDTLLAHHVRTFAHLGTRRFVLVVDDPASAVAAEARVLAGAAGASLDVVVQAERKGIGHAVLLAEAALGRGPFVLVLGDTYYVARDLAGSMADIRDGPFDAVLSVRRTDDENLIRKECTIALSDDGRVTRIVEKPRDVLGPWKPCGVYFFGPAVLPVLRATPASALRGEVEITDAIQVLIDRGGRVGARQTLDLDVNVTWPADLLDANLAHLAAGGHRFLADGSARIGPGVSLDRCVIGARASVGEGSRLARVVVFPDAVVGPGAALSDALVSPLAGVVPCR